MATDAQIPPSTGLQHVAPALLALCGLALTAGTIHVVAAIEHVGGSFTLGLFFALVGLGQLLAGWLIYRRPDDRRLITAAAIGTIAVAMLWVWSRTAAMPFGPEADKVTGVGVADTIVTLHELAFALIAAAIVRRRAGEPDRLAWLGGAMGTRLTYALLSASLFAAAVGGHQH